MQEASYQICARAQCLCNLSHFKCRSERVPETKLPARVSRISARPDVMALAYALRPKLLLKTAANPLGGRGVGAGGTREARLGSKVEVALWRHVPGWEDMLSSVHCMAYVGSMGWLAAGRSDPFFRRNGPAITFHLLFCHHWWRDDTPGDGAIVANMYRQYDALRTQSSAAKLLRRGPGV